MIVQAPTPSSPCRRLSFGGRTLALLASALLGTGCGDSLPPTADRPAGEAIAVVEHSTASQNTGTRLLTPRERAARDSALASSAKPLRDQAVAMAVPAIREIQLWPFERMMNAAGEEDRAVVCNNIIALMVRSLPQEGLLAPRGDRLKDVRRIAETSVAQCRPEGQAPNRGASTPRYAHVIQDPETTDTTTAGGGWTEADIANWANETITDQFATGIAESQAPVVEGIVNDLSTYEYEPLAMFMYFPIDWREVLAVAGGACVGSTIASVGAARDAARAAATSVLIVGGPQSAIAAGVGAAAGVLAGSCAIGAVAGALGEIAHQGMQRKP